MSSSKRGVTLEAEVCEVLRGFYEKARTVRGWTPVDHPARRTSVLLSELLFELWTCDDVPLRVLDEAMGARPGTTRMRLARHGFRRLPPSATHSRYQGKTPDGRPGEAKPHLRIDIAGQTFNQLTAIEPTGDVSTSGVLWRFRCSCGAERIAAAGQVKAGRVKTCTACGATARAAHYESRRKSTY